MSYFLLLLLYSVQSQQELDYYDYDYKDLSNCVATCNKREVTNIKEVSCQGVFKWICLFDGESDRIDCIGQFNSSIFYVNGQRFLRNYCDGFYQNVYELSEEYSQEEMLKELTTCTGTHEWTHYIFPNDIIDYYLWNHTCTGTYIYTQKTGLDPLDHNFNITNAGILMLEGESILETPPPPGLTNCNYTCYDEPYINGLCMEEFDIVCDYRRNQATASGDFGQYIHACVGMYGGSWKGSACIGPTETFYITYYDDSDAEFVIMETCSEKEVWMGENYACEGVYSHIYDA